MRPGEALSLYFRKLEENKRKTRALFWCTYY